MIFFLRVVLAPFINGTQPAGLHFQIPACQFSEIVSFLFFFKDFIYLFIETQRERQRHRQREKRAPRREPDVGLNPGSPGSDPGLQAALNRCATGGAPYPRFNK